MPDNKLYTISEYGLIGYEGSVESANGFLSKKVSTSAFEEFEAFAKTEAGKDVLGFSGNGKYLQAKNYVGTIQTQNGYTLEILPKIYGTKDDEKNTKEIFLELLRLLYKLPTYKHINKAQFQDIDMPILEIFIRMFLEELSELIKRGIKSDYLRKEENIHFLKGKLLVNQQLKYNYIHKERFYVAYDEYSQNRVENRLIKSTLILLSKLSKSYENLSRIRHFSEMMFSIDVSTNYGVDFRRCKVEVRGMEHYRILLIWAKIFLNKNSFSSFQGTSIAFAILYPMEKLFENYVEHYLVQRYSRCDKIDIIAQQSDKIFVKSLFSVRPDFLIKKDDTNLVVADAKWKIISKEKPLSQSDFYQLFAYKHIYKDAKLLRLYYPKSDFFITARIYKYFDGSKIHVIPLDMNKIIENCDRKFYAF